MKISICITVFNEEDTIDTLLDSLVHQTQRPYEIVVVDGGSTDRTLKKLRSYQNKFKYLKVFTSKGNIAHGRNISIEKAYGEIIVLIDAGCRAYSDWLLRITEPLNNKNVGLVAGFYHMLHKTSLQKALNCFQGTLPKDFNKKTFLPSARSVAFRKSVWKQIGGFDETLQNAGEDSKFFYEVVVQGINIVRVKEAVVEWYETRELSLLSSFRKFYSYAKGDGESGIWWHPHKRFFSHNIKIMTIFGRYGIFGIFLVLSIFLPEYRVIVIGLIVIYSIWSYIKVYRLTRDIRAGFWGIVIQMTSDWAVMMGFIAGTMSHGIQRSSP